MALKRRVEKSYSIEEMMEIINEDFIMKSGHSRHYIIGNTCFTDDSEKYLVADLRYANTDFDDLLPTYYGHSILEAVTKCFLDKYRRESNDSLSIPPLAPPIPAATVKRQFDKLKPSLKTNISIF